MKNYICPGTDTAKTEFQALADIVGDTPAYTAWSFNGGYPMDISPNGEPSQLFQALLTKFNNDPVLATQEKVKMLSKSFRDSYRGARDLNDEPLIVLAPYKTIDSGDPVLNRTIDGLMKNNSSSKILDLIITNTSSEEGANGRNSVTNKIARVFKDLILDGFISDQPISYIDGDVSVNSSDEYRPNTVEDNAAGIYLYRNDGDLEDVTAHGILITTDFLHFRDNAISQEFFLETVFHEITHHYTIKDLLSKNSELKSLVSDIYTQYKEVYPGYYETTDEGEFISEVLTSRRVYERLAELEVKDGLIKRFIKAVKKVLNNIFNTKFNISPTKYGYNNVNRLIDDILNIIENRLKTSPYLNSGVEIRPGYRNLNDLEYSLLRLSPIGESNVENAKQIMTNIKQGVKNRITDTEKRTTDTAVTRRLRQLQTVLDASEDIDAMLEFIKYASRDIKAPLKLMEQAANGKRTLTPRELRQFRSDYIGFYTKIISDINGLHYKGFFNIFDDGTPKGKSFVDFINEQLPLVNAAIQQMDSVSKTLVELAFKDILREKGLEVNNPFIEDYIAENTIHTSNDLGWTELTIGSMANANDYALKTIWNTLQNAKNEVKRNSVAAGKDILKASEGVGVRERLQLFEKDSEGRRTGYIIRQLRYGEFKRDYYAFLSDLRNEYGLDEDHDYPLNEIDFKAFNKRKNNWINEHSNRRYIKDYYDLYADLSMDTTIAREEIQNRIDQILSGAYDGQGNLDLMRLNANQYDRLLLMYRRKKELANRYDLDGNEKFGKDAEIAEELSALNDAMEGRLLYKEQTEAYNKAKEAAKVKYGENSEQFNEWLRRNSRTAYTPEFWEILKRIDKNYYGEEYSVLEEDRQEIFKLYRKENNLEIDEESMSEESKQLIKYIDNRMQAIRSQALVEPIETNEVEFKDIATMVESPEYHTAIANARKLDIENPGTFQNFLQNEHYIGFKGKLIPYSYWRVLKPKNAKYIVEVPTRAWQEIDPASPWYNKDYNQEDGEYMQPKDAKYNNKEAYDKVVNNPKLERLRQKLIESYAESNNKLLYRKNMDPHKLAQMSGSLWQTIQARGSVRKGLGKYITDGLIIKGDDLDYGQSIQSPNGEQLFHIPTHFLRDLEDAELMTNDIVGATISYWEMAENYAKMTRVAPEIEIIKEQLGLRTFDEVSGTKVKSTNNPGTESRAYKKADLFIRMNLYGETKQRAEVPLTMFNSDKRVSLTKALGALRNYAQTVNLGWNLTAMEVGFLTGLHHSILQSLVGQHYQKKDFAWGYGNVIKNMFHIMINWGNARSNNKLLSLMEMNQISTTTDTMFGRLNYSRLGRFIMEHLWYGGYAGGDFVVKGSMLSAIYSNYRLYTDPTTGNSEFISKNDFLMRYFPDNKQSGRQAWKLLKTSLYDAYYSENGIALVKDEFKKLVTTRLVDIVNNKTRYLAAKADGVLSPLDKTILHQNAFGQLFTMHRGWMFSVVSNRILKKKGWNYQTGTIDMAEYKIFGKYGSILLNKLKQALGRIQAESNTSPAKTTLDDAERNALRTITYEAAMFLAYYIIAMQLGKTADEDESTWLEQHLAYMALRGTFEIRSQYNPNDVISLIKSPTPAMGTINQWLNMADLLINSLYLPYDKNFGKPVKSGPYKEDFLDFKFNNGTRNIIKATPFKHIIEGREPNVKRKYLDNMIMR